jgi:uncharacterized protein (DUF58 family)
LSVFSDKLDIHTAAKSSLTHHRFLYSELEKRMKDYEEKSRSGTDAIQALHDISELTHQRSMVVIFTDLLDDPNRIDELFRAIQHLKHNKHEVILFHVLDSKLERNFELENRPYQLIDMESGEKMNLQPAEVRAHYVKGIEAYFNEVKMRCVNHRVDFMTADIHEGYNQVLLQYLLKRQKLF